MGFSSGATPVHPPDALSVDDFPKYQPARPRDDEWFGGPAALGFSDTVYLMIHRAWTICVGRDKTDSDWQLMVKRGVFLSLQQFVAAGDPGPKHATIDGSFASRELAAAQARAWIAKRAPRWRSSSRKRHQQPAARSSDKKR
jgi:hypothetical protein